MKRSTPLVLATASAAVLGLAGPATAAPSAPRTLLSGHVSISGVSGDLPAGATISVLQYCPAGSRLDKAATRTAEAEVDTMLDPHVRLASREFWPAGTVSRYRVVRRVAGEDGVPLLNAALCTSTVSGSARTVSGRAATDLRVWGPAPARLDLANVTVALVTDDPDGDHVFATAMKAAGVASSRGSINGAVRAVQHVVQEDGLSAVVAVGKTNRRVARGCFVSMRNAYSYVSDLTRKITSADSRV